eukprot:TRINITY_DN1963_c0_g2_i1.p1 TRINITY_DN1963_c0_g2~~TRINITY_DN1963_c0_g2_i1.p1  ORF type:complete len:227 (+),score=26.57 TRINITY_DN1963_c0_g2_i1:63-743(+)
MPAYGNLLTMTTMLTMGFAILLFTDGAKSEEVDLGRCEGVGLQPIIDITIPHSITLNEMIAVVYSLVPWGIALVAVWFAVMKRTSTSVVILAYMAFVICVNEALVKRNFPQPRPGASCIDTPGMPSSHSLLAIGVLVWGLLEMGESKSLTMSAFFMLLMALAPVPHARVVLNDHSPKQALAGSLLGISAAITFVQVRKKELLYNWCDHWIAKKLGIINDFVAPEVF